MVKDHSDSDERKPAAPHGLSDLHYPIANTTTFITPVVQYWLEREIAQWGHHEGSIRRPIAPWANVHTTELHLAPPVIEDKSVRGNISDYNTPKKKSSMMFCIVRTFLYINDQHNFYCVHWYHETIFQVNVQWKLMQKSLASQYINGLSTRRIYHS